MGRELTIGAWDLEAAHYRAIVACSVPIARTAVLNSLRYLG